MTTPPAADRPQVSRRRSEQGSAAIEAAVGLPAFTLFLAMIIMAGRVAVAAQSLDAAAFDAARAASIERTRPEALQAGKSAAQQNLSAQHLRCARTTLTIDATALSKAPGIPGQVEVTLTCTLALADLSLPGVPGTRTLTVTATSPIDTYRASGAQQLPGRLP